jgi:hypothetical protein
MAENGSSSSHINIISDNSSSKSADKTINIKIPSDSNQTYLTIITIIVAAISAGAAWTTYHYAKNAYHFNALIKVFDMLNDNAHRNARIRLYRVNGVRDEDMRRAYLKELGVKDEALKTIIPESQNIVLADLDQIGTLVKNGLVPEKEFLEVYWNTVVSCYKVVEEDGKTKLYVNFKELYDRAGTYIKNDVSLESQVFGPNASRITFHKRERISHYLKNNYFQ